MQRKRGHTLPEMLLAVALVATTLGYGIPAFRTLSLDTARTREVNIFVHGLYLARSEAIKRNGVVSLCPSQDGNLCAAAGTPWHSGWIVFVNLDRDQPAVRDSDEDVLHVFGMGQEPGLRQAAEADLPVELHASACAQLPAQVARELDRSRVRRRTRGLGHAARSPRIRRYASRKCSAQVSRLRRSQAHSRPARPIDSHRSLSASKAASAAASDDGSFGAASRPVFPCRTISVRPP